MLRQPLLSLFFLGLACALAAAPLQAQDGERAVGAETREALALTVYNQDLGLVSETRRLELQAGDNLLALQDVSRQLRPETVIFQGAGLELVEQDFTYDLLTPQRLLESSLGRKVQIVKTHPQTGAETLTEAEVLSVAQGPVLKTAAGIETGPFERLVFPDLPANLRARPTLRARVAAAAAGPKALSFSYLTGGLTWKADYVGALNAAEDGLELTALVTLANTSGADYADARVRLVAGSVRQVQARPGARNRAVMMESDMAFAAAPPPPEPQSVADRYLYQLARPVSLSDRETKQVPLLSAQGVALTKEYRFQGLINANQGGGREGFVNAALILEFENTEANGLGQPLPGGTLRVYRTAGAEPLFIGEDRLGHTPAGEKLRLQLGDAFDVTARAQRTVFERLSNKSYETGQEVRVKNAKDQPVSVVLVGDFPPGWQMLSESARHERESASRVLWRLQVPAKGEAQLTYRLRVKR